MTSIIKQFDVHSNKYTFDSSGAYDSGHLQEYGISKESTFYTQYNSPNYWQITFSQPVTAGSYKFRPYRPGCGYVSSWEISISNSTTFTFIQSNSLSSQPSGAAKFHFPKPISFRSFKITSKTVNNNVGEWLHVNQFDLFGPIGAPKERVTINYKLNKQRKIRNVIILMMQLTTC